LTITKFKEESKLADFEIIRDFVSASEFSNEVKEALMEAIALEIQGKPIADYSALVKKMAAGK
jgi:hypothetical protein